VQTQHGYSSKVVPHDGAIRRRSEPERHSDVKREAIHLGGLDVEIRIGGRETAIEGRESRFASREIPPAIS